MTASGLAQIVVVDAGPLIGFAAANRLPLFTDVFKKVSIEIVTPFEVHREE